MRDINVVRRLSTPKACARKIQAALLVLEAGKGISPGPYLGRDKEEAALRTALAAPPGVAPVAIHAVGHFGIGRHTFVRNSLGKFFPRFFSVFIDIPLSLTEGAEEVYRRLSAGDACGSARSPRSRAQAPRQRQGSQRRTKAGEDRKGRRRQLFPRGDRRISGQAAPRGSLGGLGKNRWLLEPAYAAFGDRPVGEITAPELLHALRKFEMGERYESARRLRAVTGMVFRYAIATGRATRDISVDLRGGPCPSSYALRQLRSC